MKELRSNTPAEHLWAVAMANLVVSTRQWRGGEKTLLSAES